MTSKAGNFPKMHRLTSTAGIFLNNLTWRFAKHLLLEGGHGEEGGHLGKHGERGGRLLVLAQVALGVNTVIIIMLITKYLRCPRGRRRLMAGWESALQSSREHSRVERTKRLLGRLWARTLQLVWGQLGTTLLS